MWPSRCERAVDGLIQGVPVRSRPRLQSGFRLVPGRLEILQARLRPDQIALVQQRLAVGDEVSKGSEVSQFGRRGLRLRTAGDDKRCRQN